MFHHRDTENSEIDHGHLREWQAGRHDGTSSGHNQPLRKSGYTAARQPRIWRKRLAIICKRHWAGATYQFPNGNLFVRLHSSAPRQDVYVIKRPASR